MSLIRKLGAEFKVTFGISGTALEQLKKYVPEVIDSFRQLYKTGNVEFVAETYSNSLAMITHPAEYKRQVKEHEKTLDTLIGCKPTTLANANLLYSDLTAGIAQEMGFNTVLVEGAKQVLGWKSPNYLYVSRPYPAVRLLLRNSQLSDDISLRFPMREWDQWPLTAEKLMSWLDSIDKNQELVNLFMDYGALGEYPKSNAGIFRFMDTFIVKMIKSGKWIFRTVSEAAENIRPAASLDIPHYISWAGEERDLSAWLGNEMQLDALNTLYTAADIMENCEDKELLSDWSKLQTCDHFCYMSTKYMKESGKYRVFSPYSSPYEAFVNYMNILTDFLIRVKEYAAHNALSSMLRLVQNRENEGKKQQRYQPETI